MKMMTQTLWDWENPFPEPDSVNDLNVDGLRYIDYAATGGNINTLIDLVEKHDARIENNAASSWTNLFFWIAISNDTDNRRQMFEWLKKEERYQQLKNNVSASHLNAVLETFSPRLLEKTATNQVDSFGMSPLHYYALANTVDADNTIIANITPHARLFNQPLTHSLQNATGLLLLAECQRWNVLQSLISHTVTINADAQLLVTKSAPFSGRTLAALLFDKDEWSMLESVMIKSDSVDADAETTLDLRPTENIVTLALALTIKKQMNLLKILLEKTNTINANAKRTGAKYTLAQRLVHAFAWDHLTLLINKASSPVDFEINSNEFKKLMKTLFQKKHYRLITTIFNKVALPEGFALNEVLEQEDYYDCLLEHLYHHPEEDSCELYHAIFPNEDPLKDFETLCPFERIYAIKHQIQALTRLDKQVIESCLCDFLERTNTVLSFFYRCENELKNYLVETLLILFSVLQCVINHPEAGDAMNYNAIFHWCNEYPETFNLESLSLIDKIDLEKMMAPHECNKLNLSESKYQLKLFFCIYIDILNRKNNEAIHVKKISVTRDFNNNPNTFYSLTENQDDVRQTMNAFAFER